MQSDNSKLLEDGSLFKLIIRYIIPSIVTMLFFGLQNIIDGVVVGNHVGFEGLGGVNIILPMYSMILVVALTVGVGCQTLVSHGLGSGDLKSAQNSMTTGFISLTIVDIIATILLLTYAEPITLAFGAKEQLFPHALSYYKGLVLFMTPISISLYSDFMLKALGRPFLSMAIMSSVIVLNIILSITFVQFFDMGTYGAAIATGLAYTIGLFASASVTFSKSHRLSMLKGKMDIKLLLHGIYNGSSEGFSELATGISVLIVNLAIGKFAGAKGVAAFTAINYINLMGTLVFLGITDGLIPVLAYNYGADNYRRVINLMKSFTKIIIFIGIILFLLLQIEDGHLIKIFIGNSNTSLIEITSYGLRIFAFIFLFNGTNILITSFFTALSDAWRSIIIASLRGMIFVAIAVSFLPAHLGITGIWAAIPLAEFLTLGVSYYLLIQRFRSLTDEIKSTRLKQNI